MQTPKKKLMPGRNVPLNELDKYTSLYFACRRHVDELVADAELLFNNGRYARAFFLAITAYEELGKSQLVADYCTNCVSKEEFLDAFKRHSIKLAYIQCNVLLTKTGSGPGCEATVRYDTAEAKDYLQLRNDSLYASFRDDYVPVLPHETIRQELAAKAIHQVKETIDHIRACEHANERIGLKALMK